MTHVQKIAELLDKSYIIDIEANNKKGALKELLEVICRNELITDPKVFEKEIFKREKMMSTGIGFEIAIPHARHKSIKDFVIAIGRKKEGLKYESLDDKPVKLLFMIGASDTQDKDYIKLLSRIMLRLKNHDFKQTLIDANNTDEIYRIIEETI